MRALVGTFAVVIGGLLACGGLATPEPADTDSGAAAPPEEPDELGVEEPPPPPPAPTVAPAFEGIPGWLGLATAVSARRDYTPRTEAAAVVVPWPEPFEGVATDARFEGTSSGGRRVALVFTGIQEVAYGCDGGTPTRMALFSSPDSVDEGPVWLVAQGGPAVRVVTPLPAGEASATSRAWTLGDLGVALKLDGRSGRLTETLSGRTFEVPFEIPEMDGAEIELTVASDATVGVPYPEALFSLGGQSVLVTRASSFEGVHFAVHAVEPAFAEAGDRYLYQCAF
jgi:hypothetical protein